MRKSFPLLACALLVLFQCSPTFAQEQQAETPPPKEVTRVIDDFWTALGAFDAEAMKQTFDWPVSIVEASAKLTKNPRVLTSPTDLDKEFTGPRPASGRSEFYGAKLSNFKIQNMSDSLAIVTYLAQIPTKDAYKDGEFNAVAIVRKISPGNTWKIIFITVPN